MKDAHVIILMLSCIMFALAYLVFTRKHDAYKAGFEAGKQEAKDAALLTYPWRLSPGWNCRCVTPGLWSNPAHVSGSPPAPPMPPRARPAAAEDTVWPAMNTEQAVRTGLLRNPHQTALLGYDLDDVTLKLVREVTVPVSYARKVLNKMRAEGIKV